MKFIRFSFVLSVLVLFSCGEDPGTGGKEVSFPPFSGTIFVDPDIITEDDPTSFESITPNGTGTREMFDRRVNAFITTEPFLFNVTYDDGLTTEVQVNPEFSLSLAAEAAEKYAIEIGRLPTSLRIDVQTVWIHQGTQPFGGGNNNILIHVGQADLYVQDGILEETLVHEASHTSLDADHAENQGWVEAQLADKNYISTYAAENPVREDIAESFLMYLAIKYREDRIDSSVKSTIEKTIPNRILYFDAQPFNMYPIE